MQDAVALVGVQPGRIYGLHADGLPDALASPGCEDVARPRARLGRRRHDPAGASLCPATATTTRASSAAVAARVAVVFPGRVASSVEVGDEGVEDEELDLELDTVDAGLEGALQIKEVVAAELEADEGDVEGNNEQIGEDELDEDVVLGPVDGSRTAGRRGAAGEERGEVDRLARLVNVEQAEECLLGKVYAELDAVPDDVVLLEARIDVGRLL